jgi:shikimate kinase
VELLNAPGHVIIGLGGGTPCYANNHEQMERCTVNLSKGIN